VNFEEYLTSKRIDASAFKEKEEELYDSLQAFFDQVHPDSFTQQKLFLINPLRRKYHLKKDDTEPKQKPKKPIKPKPKI